ncbi:Methyl-CpG-binding domain protein 5 [Eumeta japonica]|uniref:Methyl-CpG-binding domain protein 5 n=1 Tax=Eumeta variegata TaxID=151549 RepID=A0A4C1YTB5_EUMVA|nr:Methyl-CpG-binding domain protein 5 [Eumeta japonica]
MIIIRRRSPGSLSEVPVLKRKMKKPGYTGNMTVSQLMVQRERYGVDSKVAQQDGESITTISSIVAPPRANSQSCPPVFGSPIQQGMTHSGLSTSEAGDNIQRHRQYSGVPTTCGSALNIGQPVLGTNGQVIGVNTGVNRPTNVNYKNINSSMQPLPHDQELREDKKTMSEVTNQQTTIPTVKQSVKEEEPQLFCGLNQPLTPEVMQKINEQQQIFIQQNQKQIEMAMKEYRSQLSENVGLIPNKTHGANQYTPQNQLVIQNGTVMKANPAKTPPWQVKRNDSQCPSTTPNSKSINVDKIDYDESSIPEDSPPSVNMHNSATNMSNNDSTMNQMMCSRVPPLPQHYTIMNQQWPNVDINKKKSKNNKNVRKKPNSIENKSVAFGANGMRVIQDVKGRNNDEVMHGNPTPSFMDDPNGYLAQQTVLLNNTISKQVGINASYEHNQFENQNCGFNFQSHNDKFTKSTKVVDLAVYRNNVPNSLSSPNNTPDSSVSSDKSLENNFPQCCKGCTVSGKSNNSEHFSDSLKRSYIKQAVYHKLDLEQRSETLSPKHSFEDSPVTSSTYSDRNTLGNDKNAPIQAATVSTSNVSPMETLLPPEPSPTPSNSSRSTDTPHSNNSGGNHFPTNCGFAMQSPVYSNPGSCSNYNSNPPTPGSVQSCSYNSPGPPNHSSQAVTGTQMMHFISNHNVNKNLMEVDNISLVGVKPGFKPQDITFKGDHKKNILNNMPGYCPPPHLGGGPAHSLIHATYIQSFVTTMASGFSVTRNTITSVLAGKAQTATTSINASTANYVRAPPPPSTNLATSYAIPNNQPDPFLNSVNLPTSYPLHIAGTTAQNMIAKSPLEMVQNVIGSIPSCRHDAKITPTTQIAKKLKDGPNLTPGQILISSTGQIIVSNSSSPMPPPPPKTTLAISPASGSSVVTNVTASVTQVMPAVGGVQQVVNQPTVLVNTLQPPFVLQPPVMAVDGQVVPQNTVLPQIVTGGLVTPTQSPNVSPGQGDMKSGTGYLQGVAMLSPESIKKKNKKKKNHTNVTNVLHISAPQQNANNVLVQHSSPQHNTSPQFSPRSFQLSPNNNIASTPMLQALTIVPGKSGTPAHIVMNGQGNSGNFTSQQIITNTSPTPQINLLQPVNLINNGSGVVSNFPAFQQFLVPNLGSMVMTADGTAIIQDNASGVPVQLQLQTVNGQNVLTPVQNPGVFTAGTNAGVVIRAQNQQGKILQSQHSPGAQFLSPNSNVMMSSPNFNGQMSPLLANLSPQNVTFATSPHQVRSANAQGQELVQSNQMGQTLMVPLSPKPITMNSGTTNRGNSTFVQQNTTIVQQQTTLVSNQHNNHMSSLNPHLHGTTAARLSIDPNILLSNAHKQMNTPMKGRHVLEIQSDGTDSQVIAATSNNMKSEDKSPMAFVQSIPSDHLESHERNEIKINNSEQSFGKVISDGFNQSVMGQMQHSTLAYSSHVRHSVSTQTLVNQQRGKSPSAHQVSGSSPPDTTTHSPLGALEGTASPRLYGARSLSTQGNYADTTTKSPEPADANSSAMVQCVSSSEQDMAESRENSSWSAASDFTSDSDTQNMLTSNVQLMRHNRNTKHIGVESSEILYNQTISVTSVNNQQSITITPTGYYDRPHSHKRKNEFTENQSYRSDKMMRMAYGMVHGPPKEIEFDQMQVIPYDKSQKAIQRHFSPGNSSDGANNQKMFERHLSTENEEDSETKTGSEGVRGESEPEGDMESSGAMQIASRSARRLEVGQLVWGPVKGYASWPGKLVTRRPPGRWLVRWFGGRPPSAVESARLLTLTEGLEAHHAARTKHRKSRKLNTHLENAIQEAMAELDKKSESGLDKEHGIQHVEPTEDEDHDAHDAPPQRRPTRGRRAATEAKKKAASTLSKHQTPSHPIKAGLRSAR